MIWLKKLKEKWLAENAISESAVDDNYLSLFQEKNDVRLPDDLIEYFKSLNGTGGDYADDFYKFYSIDRIRKVKEEFKNWHGVPNYQDILSINNINDLYVFADFNCNLFAYAIELRSKFANKNDVYILCGENYKKIANSFSEFIDLYLKDAIELQFS
ncbi:SMI1/KNR4 family protein [Pedobacter heparinus]|uniref:SMI1/KNR4 family protein n=1 Tax=Pedobacter heparinus TaxID=984 RepID=UPI0029308C03|nr:SMI1/KNR4 family protein [Pedobacter heparinus]